MKRYVEVLIDAAVVFIAHRFLGWLGVVGWVVFLIGWYGTGLIATQTIVMNTLLSRLPDRCRMCHREIVDEGGLIEEDGIYHTACYDRLQMLNGKS